MLEFFCLLAPCGDPPPPSAGQGGVSLEAPLADSQPADHFEPPFK
eukprot:gene29143-40511_t